MRFNNSFKIWLIKGTEISLEAALELAKNQESDLVYDPLGLGTPESWWFCVAVLTLLKQDEYIYDFEILKDAPKSQLVESEKGVTY